MIRGPPRATRTATRVPATPLFRSCPASTSLPPPGRPLPATPLRLALFLEGSRAFLRIFAAIDTIEQVVAGAQGRRAPHLGRKIDQFARGTHRQRRIGGDFLRHGHGRSEEHTSELQSPMPISYAVFGLNHNTNH